ncbi:hypothetical protein [Methylomonas sp. DH-1]|uniref:hypothetical protein n=1 Tax=Methylomonas sp. (strain DH-1) TaxID=1727196 RepID=UPI001E3BB5A8|nr:hypothetical protein [Methylomonas sp. DH-1]
MKPHWIKMLGFDGLESVLKCLLGLLPFAAPSTGAFGRISPLGAPQGSGALPKGQEPLSATPFKSEERRKKAASGPPFLWILSFGGAKESISPSGARTRLKQLRDSETLIEN